jgi:uncharacterized protein YndB with AHSA1/START domain
MRTESTKTMLIDRPVNEVFNFVKASANLPRYWPYMREVHGEKRLANGGCSFHWSKNSGVRSAGVSQDTEFVPNKRIVAEGKGGATNSTVTWGFQPEGDGTRLDLSIGYRMPVPLFGPMLVDVFVRPDRNEADTILTALKAILEV